MIVVGAKEAEQNKVAVRSREAGDIGQMTQEEFLNKIQEEIENKVR